MFVYELIFCSPAVPWLLSCASSGTLNPHQPEPTFLQYRFSGGLLVDSMRFTRHDNLMPTTIVCRLWRAT